MTGVRETDNKPSSLVDHLKIDSIEIISPSTATMIKEDTTALMARIQGRITWAHPTMGTPTLMTDTAVTIATALQIPIIIIPEKIIGPPTKTARAIMKGDTSHLVIGKGEVPTLALIPQQGISVLLRAIPRGNIQIIMEAWLGNHHKDLHT